MHIWNAPRILSQQDFERTFPIFSDFDGQAMGKSPLITLPRQVCYQITNPTGMEVLIVLGGISLASECMRQPRLFSSALLRVYSQISLKIASKNVCALSF